MVAPNTDLSLELLRRLGELTGRVSFLETLEGGGSGGSDYNVNSRLLDTADTLTIEDTYSLIVSDYFQILGTLTLNGDGALEVI